MLTSIVPQLSRRCADESRRLAQFRARLETDLAAAQTRRWGAASTEEGRPSRWRHVPLVDLIGEHNTVRQKGPHKWVSGYEPFHPSAGRPSSCVRTSARRPASLRWSPARCASTMRTAFPDMIWSSCASGGWRAIRVSTPEKCSLYGHAAAHGVHTPWSTRSFASSAETCVPALLAEAMSSVIDVERCAASSLRRHGTVPPMQKRPGA
jgi:hypothetical protein